MLICYHVSNMPPFMEKEKQILELCKSLGILTYKLTDEDCEKKIGEIVGIPVMGSVTIKANRNCQGLPEVLLFSGVPDAVLDEFLAQYKTAQIAPVALKAIVTPHNVSWTLGQLLSELEKERLAYEKKKG